MHNLRHFLWKLQVDHTIPGERVTEELFQMMVANALAGRTTRSSLISA
jgi:hypothetical protein